MAAVAVATAVELPVVDFRGEVAMQPFVLPHSSAVVVLADWLELAKVADLVALVEQVELLDFRRSLLAMMIWMCSKQSQNFKGMVKTVYAVDDEKRMKVMMMMMK